MGRIDRRRRATTSRPSGKTTGKRRLAFELAPELAESLEALHRELARDMPHLELTLSQCATLLLMQALEDQTRTRGKLRMLRFQILNVLRVDDRAGGLPLSTLRRNVEAPRETLDRALLELEEDELVRLAAGRGELSLIDRAAAIVHPARGLLTSISLAANG